MNGGGVYGPGAYELLPRTGPATGILFSTLVQGMTPIRRMLFPVLAQLTMGCSNPLSVSFSPANITTMHT